MLDHETQFPGCLHIVCSNVADSFHLNGVSIHLRTESKFGQDFQLLRRILAIDVEAGIGFGEAFSLRVAERVLELDAILCHARENVIAGAVKNPTESLNIISNQAIP